MRKTRCLCVCLVVASRLTNSYILALDQHRKLWRAKGDTIPNNYMVALDPTRVVSAHEAADRLVPSDSSATVDLYYEGHAAFGFEVSNVTDTLLQTLLNHEDVLLVEENQPTLLQSVSSPQQQQHRVAMENIQFTTKGTWGLDYISWPMDNLYAWSRNGTGVTAYVLDSGIYMKHQEFAPNRASCGYEVLEQGTNCADLHGHGSNVASIIGGNEYGVAKNVQLVAVKVVDKDGGGSMATVVAGIDWVIADRQSKLQSGERHPSIINLSVGGGVSTMLNDAVERAAENGILVVGAAGNKDGLDACDMSPPSANGIIAVGALGNGSRHADYTNVGPCIDIWAPGTDIMGAGIDAVDAISIRTGTSQASPHVTGLASLYMEDGLSADETMQAIVRDARHVEALGRHNSPPLAAYSGLISSLGMSEDVESPTQQPTLASTESPSFHPSLRPTNSPTLHPTNDATTAPMSVPVAGPNSVMMPTYTSTGPVSARTGMPAFETRSAATSSPSLQPSKIDGVLNSGTTDLPSASLRSETAEPIVFVPTDSPSMGLSTEDSIPSELSADSISSSAGVRGSWDALSCCITFVSMSAMLVLLYV